MVVAVVAAAAFVGTPTCRVPEVRQHDEVVFGHFASAAAARGELAKAHRVGFQGLKIEDDGCGDQEVEIDGADTGQQRSSVAAEAGRVGFPVSFEQQGEPLQPPAGQTVGVFANEGTLGAANALVWKLAALGFRYVDVVPSGRRWLVVMPQVPVRSVLSIVHEVAQAGYRIQFHPG